MIFLVIWYNKKVIIAVLVMINNFMYGMKRN